MNVQRFTAKTAREALALVRQALGDDAVVLSTRPAGDGVEVLALAPDGMARIAQAAAQADRVRAPAAPAAAAPTPIKTVQLVTAPAAAPGRPATLAERIAARGEKLAPRLTSLLESRLDNRLDGRRDSHKNERQEPSLDGPSGGPSGVRPPGVSASQRASPGAADAQPEPSVAQDVATLGMSTLTFQDYVRERMLKRRQAELTQQAPDVPTALRAAGAPGAAEPTPAAASSAAATQPRSLGGATSHSTTHTNASASAAAGPLRHQALRDRINPPRREPPVLRDEIRPGQAGAFGAFGQPGRPALLDDGAPRPAAFNPGTQQTSDASNQPSNPRERNELMGELRSVRKLIDERFGMLAFMERLQRDPRQASLSQQLFEVGLSPALVRKLVQSLPAASSDRPDGAEPLAWAAGVLQRNLLTDEHELPLEDHDGVLALIGPTGVGKTTSCAKIAAAFASKHGANQLGLITLDAYRVAAHEQLRTYGRILGVPVHTAHDKASLEDLLELLSGKKLVLIDTAGMAQRDVRTRELLDMLQHPLIKKLLVVNAAAQGETVEDVMVGYAVQQCRGVIVSKLDEAVKLGPALDALIRHRCKVVGVANGQRVPEDWHRLSAQALVQRALRGGGGASWRLDAAEVHLLFAATQGNGYPGPQGVPLHA